MELNKCMGCMENIAGYPCPKCGYDPQKTGGNEYVLPPQTILYGKYLVGRVLGQGGFGITYIGWDLALERKVAIKEYYPSGQVSRQPGTQQLTWYTNENARTAQESGMEMFLKEARKMSRVDEIPGVVRVRDLFRENDTAYIVMDFVEGQTLKNRLKETGPMSWDQAKEIFYPAIRAMEEVHKAGIIHRDLSPDNLMLTPDGKVKILDLGAAKDLSINSGVSSMQVAKGGFSPFEQYTQRGGSGPWTDVYSMAATIYYTLTGKLPPAAIDRIEEDTISWTQPRLDTLPPKALEALKEAMTVSAQKRTQTMAELEKGLFRGSDFKAEDSKAETKTLGKKENHRLPIAAVAGVLIVLALAMVAWEPLGKPSSALESHVTAQTTGALKINTRENMNRETIRAGEYHTVCLKSDGTVVAVGDNSKGQCDVSGWRDIVSVSAGESHTVGLKSDGTVIATGDRSYGRCNVYGWRDIVSISAGKRYTVGLKSNGTVVAVGDNGDGQCDVSDWQDIVSVSAGFLHTVGLKSDGTVVAVGDNSCAQCDVSAWRGIDSVSAGGWHTIGLKSNGTVIVAGDHSYDQGNVSGLRKILIP